MTRSTTRGARGVAILSLALFAPSVATSAPPEIEGGEIGWGIAGEIHGATPIAAPQSNLLGMGPALSLQADLHLARIIGLHAGPTYLWVSGAKGGDSAGWFGIRGGLRLYWSRIVGIPVGEG